MEESRLNSIVFFLDRTHGKATRRLLASVGISVVIHDAYFGKETEDPVWLKECGNRNWVVLTGDKAIERVPENRQAVIDAKCKVLMFADTNSHPGVAAAAIIVGIRRLVEIIDRNNGPLFATIEKHAKAHISSIRFAGDGGPKPILPVDTSIPAPNSPAATIPAPTIEPIQRNLF